LGTASGRNFPTRKDNYAGEGCRIKEVDLSWPEKGMELPRWLKMAVSWII